ncbi:DUF58 domain-containing protein [Gorillibacterium sp. CAU 1737]|uniref:DUF58 domain-containing protein n=1 Tax=Gorillibacterium sp. CAU 1737 TaxID=3140362 RepID=UPI0032605C03
MGISTLLLAAGMVILLQMLLFRKRALKKIAYSREFNRTHCHAGEEVELIETLTNRKLVPLPWLRVESMIPAGLVFRRQANLDMSSGQLYQNHRSLFSLMAYTRIVRTHRVHCEARGFYHLNSVTLSAGDLLGIPAGVKVLSTSAVLLVYPRLVELSGVEMESSSYQGEVSVRRWLIDDPFLVSGVREYRYGDAFNRVNWKATARSGRLQVHERDHTADPHLVLLVNLEVGEHMWGAVTDPTMVERGLSLAASLAADAIHKGMTVGFQSNGWLIDGEKEAVRIEADGGAEQLTRLFEAMAKLVIEVSAPMDVLLEEEVLASRSGIDYVLFSSHRSPKLENGIQQLIANGNSVSWIRLDPTPLEERGEDTHEPQESQESHEAWG